MYKRSRQGWTKHWDFILLDLISLQLAYMLAYFIYGRMYPGKIPGKLVYRVELYRNLGLWMALFCVLTAIVLNTMHNVVRRGWFLEIRQSLLQCFIVFAATVLFLFSVKDSSSFSRAVLWMTFLFYLFLAFFVRTIHKWILRRIGLHSKGRSMLLITDSETVDSALEQFRKYSAETISISGVVLVDRDATGEDFGGIPGVASLDDAAMYICREWIDEVYVNVPNGVTPNTLIEQCGEMGVTVHLQLLPLNVIKSKQMVEKIAGASVITTSINIATPIQLIIKRIIDILGGLACSLVAVIIIIFIGPIIKIASPGPILYAQERIGKNGRRFKMYKIRSMYVDADKRKQELMDQNRVSDGMMFKLDWDPRIIGNRILPDGRKKTGIGEFIRKWSLDEFPQGFNILLGQMSLVGTRPPTVDEWEKYKFHHRARLATKPGLTGMWQVSGRSAITDFEEVTKLDTEYISNWNLRLDFKILFKTVGAVLKRKGAM